MAPVPSTLISRSQNIPLGELNGPRGGISDPAPGVLPSDWRTSPYGRQMWARLALIKTRTTASTSAPAKFLPFKTADVISEGLLTLPYEIGRYKLLEPVKGDPADSANRFYCVDVITKERFVCKVLLENDPRTTMYLPAHDRLRNVSQVDQVVDVIQADPETETDSKKCMNLTFIFYEEHRDRKSLDEIIRARGSFVEASARVIFRQIADLVGGCHANGVALREIKLRRLMLSLNDNRGKLTLATLDDCYVFDVDDKAEVGSSTPYYTSPEIITRRTKDTHLSMLKLDMWRLGVILFAMMMGRYPFQDSDPRRMMLKITACDFGQLPQHFSSDLKNLMTALLNPKPENRPNIVEVINHPWLQREQNENTTSAGCENKCRAVPNSR